MKKYMNRYNQTKISMTKFLLACQSFFFQIKTVYYFISHVAVLYSIASLLIHIILS